MERPAILSELVGRYLSLTRPAADLEAVAHLIADGRPLQEVAASAPSRALRAGRDHAAEAVELSLFVIKGLLADHNLTPEEIQTIRELKRILAVEEGDFYSIARDEVQCLLAIELSQLLADGKIDGEEALLQSALQQAFDLGYDQYLELTRQPVDSLVDELIGKAAADWQVTEEERAKITGRLFDLDRFHCLSESQARILYEQLPLDVPGRVISKSVRDAVWRRDRNRCVQCGSQTRLELDHIVPFSRGGSNTYRNVQLLCELCNRRKAGQIG